MTVAPQLKVAIFAQHQLDDLRPEENAYEHVRRLMPEAPEAKVRVARRAVRAGDREDGHRRPRTCRAARRRGC